jgi:hypothetical protein
VSNRPPPFRGYSLVSSDDLWAKILSGEVEPHIYSGEANGDFEPVPISAAEFFTAEEAGRNEDGEHDERLKPYQIMWRDRDRRRPSGTRRHIPVPHWVYVVREDLPPPSGQGAVKPERRGAPRKYDWPEIKRFTFEELDRRGDFAEEDQVDGWKTYADLYRAIEGKFSEKCPELTTLKERVPGFVREWREIKVAN